MTSCTRPTVLIFIDHYLPGYKSGGPTRTTANTVEWLGGDISFRILTKDRDYGDVDPYPDIKTGIWHQVGKAQVRYLSPDELSIRNLLNILRETPHHVIYTNSTFSTRTVIVLGFMRLRLIHTPIIVPPRGSLSDGALGLKSIKKRVYLALSRLIGLYDQVHWHSTSDEETRAIQKVFGGRDQPSITQIPNLTMPFNHAIQHNRTKQSGSLRIVMLSRVTRMKNLELMVDALQGAQGAITLDFWGPIVEPDYWEACLTKFQNISANIQVQHQGEVSPNRVTEVLSRYDLFFMPSLSENFGHAILEALSAGCPVLISDRTPWNEVNAKGAGWALPLDQIEQFREVIRMLVDADADTLNAYRQRALEFAEAYLSRSTAVDDMRAFLNEVAAFGRHA